MKINEFRKILKSLDENKRKLTIAFNKKQATFNEVEYIDTVKLRKEFDKTHDNFERDSSVKIYLLLRTQKEHWLGWTSEYEKGMKNHPRGYNRQKNLNITAEEIYNRILCPDMLIWLAEASGVRETLIKKATTNSLKGSKHVASICRGIREVIGWKEIEKLL